MSRPYPVNSFYALNIWLNALPARHLLLISLLANLPLSLF